MPIGSEAPVRSILPFGFRCSANSRSQTLNFVTTKPRLMTAMLVLTQAKNVRSFARYSVACLSSPILACGDSLCAPVFSSSSFIAPLYGTTAVGEYTTGGQGEMLTNSLMAFACPGPPTNNDRKTTSIAQTSWCGEIIVCACAPEATNRAAGYCTFRSRNRGPLQGKWSA